MAGYLTRLWDDYSRIVLRNTTEFDPRDSEYPRNVRAVVWQAVRELRKGREMFRAEIRREVKERKRRGPPSSKPK